LAVTLVAEQTGYALLIQGQAYRCLWILQILGTALAVPVGWRLLHAPGVKSQIAGGAIVAYYVTAVPVGLLLAKRTMTSLLLFTATWILTYAIGHGMKWPTRRRVLAASTVALVLVGLFGSTHLWMGFGSYLRSAQVLPIVVWFLATHITCALVWVCLGLALLAGVHRCVRGPLPAAVTMGGLWLLVAGLTYVVQTSEAYRQRFVRDYRNIEFVRSWLDQHDPADGGPTHVYWPTEVLHVLLRLERNSFYSWTQVQGVFFSRGVAIEGRRRSQLARRFEVAYLRECHGGSHSLTDRHSRFLGADPNDSGPTAEDLLALAADPILDWIILRQPFKGLYVATNGRIYIYDANELRRQAAAQRFRDVLVCRSPGQA
jgi:hypothetical protein